MIIYQILIFVKFEIPGFSLTSHKKCCAIVKKSYSYNYFRDNYRGNIMATKTLQPLQPHIQRLEEDLQIDTLQKAYTQVSAFVTAEELRNLRNLDLLKAQEVIKRLAKFKLP